jgi:transmembrane sensor
MKISDQEDLFKRYQSGETTPEEQAIVEDYILNNEFNPVYLSEAELEEITARLGSRISKIPFAEQTVVSLYRRWKGVTAAAAAVTAIVFGVWFYYSANTPRHPELVSGSPLANDIAPGKNTATLTLANGKTINLSDTKTGVVINTNKLSYNDGTDLNGRHPELVSGSPPQQLTASTPRGGTYIITLPDGTKVWLNADTKLEFPSEFGKNKQRIVHLSGEAYFEVAKNKRMPFIVVTDKQEVTVLGTHFNISAYGDEEASKTTLLEGSVKVTAFGIVRMLSPGQQTSLKGDEISIENVDIEDQIAWKNGNFVFNDEDLESIMRKISRWYDVEIYYQDRPQKPSSLGMLSRSKNLSALLKVLESSGKVHFKVEGRRVIVMK